MRCLLLVGGYSSDSRKPTMRCLILIVLLAAVALCHSRTYPRVHAGTNREKRMEGIFESKYFDNCQRNPCFNGGSCTDRVYGYTCACAPGYTGNNCEENVNDCIPNPCQNGGLCCCDLVNDWICLCPDGWGGKNCTEIKLSCELCNY
ncbi:delta-like protein D isoform X2 [Nematostella vectensis]|nr:delta-like protein D isoform X2 [Nematostella vectensis]